MRAGGTPGFSPAASPVLFPVIAKTPGRAGRRPGAKPRVLARHRSHAQRAYASEHGEEPRLAVGPSTGLILNSGSSTGQGVSFPPEHAQPSPASMRFGGNRRRPCADDGRHLYFQFRLVKEKSVSELHGAGITLSDGADLSPFGISGCTVQQSALASMSSAGATSAVMMWNAMTPYAPISCKAISAGAKRRPCGIPRSGRAGGCEACGRRPLLVCLRVAPDSRRARERQSLQAKPVHRDAGSDVSCFRDRSYLYRDRSTRAHTRTRARTPMETSGNWALRGNAAAAVLGVGVPLGGSRSPRVGVEVPSGRESKSPSWESGSPSTGAEVPDQWESESLRREPRSREWESKSPSRNSRSRRGGSRSPHRRGEPDLGGLRGPLLGKPQERTVGAVSGVSGPCKPRGEISKAPVYVFPGIERAELCTSLVADG